MGYKAKRVPCGVCGIDTANLEAKATIGICKRCEKIFCPTCLSSLKQKCPICGKKITFKNRITEWPNKWAPLLSIQSNSSDKQSNSADLSTQLFTHLKQNKYCRNCNRELRPDSLFCDLCGKRLKNI